MISCFKLYTHLQIYFPQIFGSYFLTSPTWMFIIKIIHTRESKISIIFYPVILFTYYVQSHHGCSWNHRDMSLIHMVHLACIPVYTVCKNISGWVWRMSLLLHLDTYRVMIHVNSFIMIIHLLPSISVQVYPTWVVCG